MPEPIPNPPNVSPRYSCADGFCRVFQADRSFADDEDLSLDCRLRSLVFGVRFQVHSINKPFNGQDRIENVRQKQPGVFKRQGRPLAELAAEWALAMRRQG